MQKLTERTDDQLIESFASGNNQAFDVLLGRHQSRVYNFIFSILKDAALSDDAFQETFVKAIATIKQGRYNADGKFSSWILRIAHNIVIDHYRQTKNESTVSASQTEYDVFNRRDLAEETIEDMMVDVNIRDDVRHLVRSLPAEQRQVLVMRYYRDMSFKQIAEKTGVSINPALGRMRYAILNLRRMARERHIELTR